MDQNVPEFTPRDPRYRVKTLAFFRFDQSTVKGHSINISESGILVAFAERLDVWITGKLTVILGESRIDVSARILRADGHQVGFAFLNPTVQDRMAIRTFVDQSNGEPVPEQAVFGSRHLPRAG
jgi:hypothetical protein